jgi:hypothetical protein
MSESFFKKCLTIYKYPPKPNTNLINAVLKSVSPIFNLLSIKEKREFMKYFNLQVSKKVSNNKFYFDNKLAKYGKQYEIQEKFQTNYYSFSAEIVNTLSNFLGINIFITEWVKNTSSFKYTMFTTTNNFERNPTIIIFTADKQKFIPLHDDNENYLINVHEYTDTKRSIDLFRTKKSQTILPYYRYNIKELQEISKKFNIPIKIEGKKKTKKELYSEISNILS